MAKFTIEVELDWLHDDDSLDEHIVARVSREIADQVIDRVGQELAEKGVDQANRMVDEKVMQLFDQPFNVTNRWGEVTGQITMLDHIKKQIENAVSESGIESLIEREVKLSMDRVSRDVSKEVDQRIREHMTDEFKETIATQLISTLKLFKR